LEYTLVSDKSFADLKLSPQTLHALERAGFEHPTPIQAGAIPPALEGRDVIGTASTGTGKTAAFLLPIIDRLAGATGTRALVLAPTRELALQITEELERFGRGRHVRGAAVIGGVGMGNQTAAFREGRTVIVATPGRLVDHLQEGTARLDGIQILVLDEADRMLDMGFKPQLDRILGRLPKVRQTLLFSATMAGEVADFAKRHLRDPARVEIARSGTMAARAEQHVYLAGQQEKLALLLSLLERDDVSTLVFTRTKRRADRLAKGIGRAGHKVERLHADRSQAQRRSALAGFKDGTYRVLVATDIAARGIDVAEIGHVVNFDLPQVPEDYVHRVGRTARASASGRASTFTSPEERDLLHAIERLTRAQIPRAEVPRDHATFQAELKRAQEVKAEAPERPPGDGHRHSFKGKRGGGSGGGRGRSQQGPGRGGRGGSHAKPGGHAGSSSGHAGRSGHGGQGGQGQGGPGGAPAKPRLIGSWGPKKRR
jgi:ATP-dependent RNA helicase RhlE